MSKMTMTAAGDVILIHGYPEGGYEGLKEIQDFIGRGQAKFANLEMCVTDWECYASAYCGGSWLSTTPEVLPQFMSYGFNFLSFANNHTMDFGPDGMLKTLENVRKYPVSVCGAGKGLGEAAKPVYRSFPGGRVAFISICSSFENAARAGYPSHTIPSRPGLNPLRNKTHYTVNAEHFAALQEIAGATKINGQKDKSRKNGFSPALPDGVLDFGGLSFRLSDNGKEETRTRCHEDDLNRVKEAIKDAHLTADYVVVMLHSHQIQGDVMHEPAEFAREFAHFCIDNGCCAVLGTGTHEFKPIEIYNGKPIFYSLGNFAFQTNVLFDLPADMSEQVHEPLLSGPQAIAKRAKGWTIGLHTQPANFRTIIPYMEFDGEKLTKLQAMPVELGFDKPRTFKGIPYPAKGEKAQEIFDIISARSASYGTKLTLKDDIIEIEI